MKELQGTDSFQREVKKDSEGDLRNDQKEMLHIRNTISEMKNGFDQLTIRLHKAKERVSDLEDMSIEISHSEIQKGKKKEWKK